MQERTNPQLRKLYRSARTIAKKADVGSKVMCPCGCLKQFKKTKKNQVFLPGNETKRHENDYNRLVKSNDNNEPDDAMILIEKTMTAYIDGYKKTQPITEDATVEKVKLTPLNSTPTSENFIRLMKQTRAVNRNSRIGSTLLCPCGCNERFMKESDLQTFPNEECKENYHELIQEGFGMNEDKETAFKIMHIFFNKVIDKLKENETFQKLLKREKLKLKKARTEEI